MSYHREQKLKKRYGLTIAGFNALAEAQNYRCGICREKADNLVVDHCHESDTVRGLLCDACNTAIGSFNDDPRIIYAAAQYVVRHSGLRIPNPE